MASRLASLERLITNTRTRTKAPYTAMLEKREGTMLLMRKRTTVVARGPASKKGPADRAAAAAASTHQIPSVPNVAGDRSLIVSLSNTPAKKNEVSAISSSRRASHPGEPNSRRYWLGASVRATSLSGRDVL